MINVGIVGASGYTGEELIDILLKHPQVRISGIFSRSHKGQPISSVFPKFKNRIDLICQDHDIKKIIASCDLVFLALPHTVSMEFVPKLLKAGKRVIDLSADYRLKNAKTYEAYYHTKHLDKANLANAVYGLPELYRPKIRTAKLVANPGCYPTVSILSLAPLVAVEAIDNSSIIIDAKSGVTGAGRKAAESLLSAEVSEDFKAYKVGVHQHTPEIEQELSGLADDKIGVIFTPHLLPVNRGILVTVYVKKGLRTKDKGLSSLELYKRFYKKEPFVRIRKDGDFPRLRDVVNTNFCDIGIREDKKTLIIIAAIDNLLKGASGEAVQNMNIMCGFPEQTALL